MPLAFEDAVAQIERKLTPQTRATIDRVIAFTFRDTGESFTLDARANDGRGWLIGSASDHGLEAAFSVTMKRADFPALVEGTLNPMSAMMTGRLRFKGDIQEALRLQKALR